MQAHLRRFIYAVSGTVGKGLERETLCPFPRLRGSGTHYETGPGFLLAHLCVEINPQFYWGKIKTLVYENLLVVK